MGCVSKAKALQFGFTKPRINTQRERGTVSEMRETRGLSRSNFNYPIGGGGEETQAEMGRGEGGGGGREGGAGVGAEMREKLYQSDQSSVLLQSPDKAGTAGGETMCIKTS